MVRRLLDWVLLLALLALLACVGLVMYVDISAARYVYSPMGELPHADVALVLGASVASNGTLSPVMKERADTAAMLYQTHHVSKIVVSGDNSTLAYNEVYPVGKYLLALGIPQQDIFLDYAGFDTYSSVYRARDVFRVPSMLIVSQHYHLPRALYIAHSLGLDAAGVDASGSGERYFIYSLREIPASLKAVFEVTMHRVPKYLGNEFPVSGSSTETWVGGAPQMIYFKK